MSREQEEASRGEGNPVLSLFGLDVARERACGDLLRCMKETAQMGVCRVTSTCVI